MAKIEKLIERLQAAPKEFTWQELIKALEHFGFAELKAGKTGGSRRKFANPGNTIISLHKPHLGSIVKEYALKEVVQTLKAANLL